MRRITTSLLLLLALVSFVAGQSMPSAVTEDTIRADMQLHVCNNGERLEAVKSLFKSKGVSDEEMKVEKVDHVENLILTKKGKTEETIVIGAHYDKVGLGCGAIDNWTGLVVLANLFAKYKTIETGKTLVFVAFGREEEGLLGAHAFVKSIPREKRGQVCAMVNLDSFGLFYPQVLAHVSDGRLTEFAKELADEVKMPLGTPSIVGADADSSAFLAKDIPAITFSGLSSRWKEYLHTGQDKIKNVNHQAVFVGYNFASLFLNRVEPKPCNAFRK